MSARKKSKANISPDYLARQKASLVRNRRQVIMLNESEEAAINAYCRLIKARSKASALRGIIMEKVLSELEENHPTLF